MKLTLQAIIAALIITAAIPLSADTTVEGVGRAAGHGLLAREQALSDALRDAVRKGAGVDLMACSKASDYVLGYDRIFSAAFGYIKSYKVISSGRDNADMYKIVVKAKVAQGRPGMNDYLAMRQIIAIKGSPRLLIKCSGYIRGVGDSEGLIMGILLELALKSGFQAVDVTQFHTAQKERKERDKILDDKKNVKYREKKIKRGYDFIIEAKVNGSYSGDTSIYDIKARKFSLGADLSAVWATGRLITQLTVPSHEFYISKISDPRQAARSALTQLLASDKGANFRALLMRILAVWITEHDTGSNVVIEFKNIEKKLLDRILEGLKKSAGINSARIREFDDKFISTIDVESRIKSSALASLTAKLSRGRLRVDSHSLDYIQMEPVYRNQTDGFRKILSIAAIAAVIGIALLLLKKNKK